LSSSFVLCTQCYMFLFIAPPVFSNVFLICLSNSWLFMPFLCQYNILLSSM
jgi:hypothetical protein